ncbi:hypothetical protein BX070DRAFT_251921 [Coemansia spiralis]|nr:hypothetical protein BX070DRAFT_251921 [Coemansia spiralis]
MYRKGIFAIPAAATTNASVQQRKLARRNANAVADCANSKLPAGSKVPTTLKISSTGSKIAYASSKTPFAGSSPAPKATTDSNLTSSPRQSGVKLNSITSTFRPQVASQIPTNLPKQPSTIKLGQKDANNLNKFAQSLPH